MFRALALRQSDWYTVSYSANPPITEMIKITIATTTYPRRNWGISKTLSIEMVMINWCK